MRSTLLLLYLLLCQALSAQAQQPTDQVAQRYASSDTAAIHSRKYAGYYLVKFREYPGESLRQYGVVKALTSRHFILKRTSFDSTLQSKMIYTLPANNNWKASTNLLSQLSQQTAITVVVIQSGHSQTLTIQTKDWEAFIAQPSITFADVQRRATPEARINSMDISANAINAVQQKYPAFRGAQITVSLKEDLFDTTDIDLTGRFIYTSYAAASSAAHATTMATMIAGAGNSGEKGMGAAPQAYLCPADFNTSLLPEESSYYNTNHISIQNHSYGTGIENYYGAEAVAFDEQVYHTDTILHVFSSGNIGTDADSTGIYANLPGYANLTGTFKQARNVLVLGATDDSLHVLAISSKGPAYDGRIKPELVAFGIDGSSGSAALGSGTAALLQNAYQQVYHTMPSAALIKAIMINSATSNGISYSSGFGSLHALHAMQTLEQKHFLQGTDNGSFTIQLPAGVQKFKVTLCWNDPPADALVNDLDIKVTDAGGNTYLPWVLSAAPIADSLAAAPHRGRDSLNNIEQITIDNPVAGALQIQVAAHHLNSPSQPFYIAYGYEAQNTFEWQNPGVKEVIVAGSPVPFPLRWYTNMTGTGSIACSYDKGASWQTLATQLNTATGLHYWTIPDTFCTALLKYSTGSHDFISDTFYLSPRLSLQTGYDCGDSAMIFWNTLHDANTYQLYNMGTRYLLPYTQTIDTFLTLNLPANSSPYYAVSPLHKDGWTGLKSYATNYQLQGTTCYFRNLLATETDDKNIALSLSLGTTYHINHLYWLRDSTLLDSSTVTPATAYDYLDANAPEGLLTYRVKLITSTGAVLYSEPATIYLLRSHDYMIFPNPVISNVTILSKALNNMQLQVFDISGKRILTTTISSLQQNVSLSTLVPGTYICVLYNDGQKVYSQQLIKL